MAGSTPPPLPDATPDSSKPRPGKLQLHPLLIVLIFIVGGLAFFIGYLDKKDAGDAKWVGYAAGNFAGILIFTLLPAWLVNWNSRGNRSAVNLTTGLLLGLVTVGMVHNAIDSRTSNNQAWMQLTEAIKEIQVENRQALKQNIDTGDPSITNASSLVRAAEVFRKHAELANGDSRRSMLAIAEVFDEFSDNVRHYQLTVEKWINVGGVDPATLGSVEQIRQRIRVVQDLADANEALRAALVNLPKNARRTLERAKAPEEMIDSFVAGMSNPRTIKIVSDVRGYETRIAEQYVHMLELLRDHWGQWSVDRQGYVIFDTAALAEQYNAIYDMTTRLGREQIEAQKKFLQ